MPRIFLTAAWRNLVLVNYRVPPEWLLPYVPSGSVLDTPDDAPDLHLLSLVAFHFADTHVYGIPVPTGQWFPELNLRFYVRRGDKRATVFLREYVPMPLVALGARLFYHQPYYLALIDHRLRQDANTIEVTTHFRHREQHGALHVRAHNRPTVPPPSSQEHFLKEHYWGFDRLPSGASFRYRVHHPVWQTFPIESATVEFNPGALLGHPWQSLDWPNALHSVLLAAGSPVTVYSAEPLEAE